MWTKVKKAKILGLALTFLSLCGLCVCCINEGAYFIVGAIFATLIQSILVTGIFMRNAQVIRLWMILGPLNIFFAMIAFVTILSHIANNYGNDFGNIIENGTDINESSNENWRNGGIIMPVFIFYIGVIILIIWTLIAANVARNGILEEERRIKRNLDIIKEKRQKIQAKKTSSASREPLIFDMTPTMSGPGMQEQASPVRSRTAVPFSTGQYMGPKY